MRTLISTLAWLGLALVLPIRAQDLNIDFTDNMATTIPPSTYGAAMNQPGVWNAWDGAGSLAPVDLSGAPTAVQVTLTNTYLPVSYDNLQTSGDDELLIDDYIVLYSSSSGVTASLTFDNLAAGLYETYTYGWEGFNAPSSKTAVGNPLSSDPGALCGGAWGGSLVATPSAWGRHRQFVGAGGSLTIKASSWVLSGALNGIQIRHTPGAVPPVSYCAGKVNSMGCTPQIGSFGYPSVSDLSAYSLSLRALQLVPGKPGLLLYSTTGRASVPFHGGVLCLASPVRRTPGQLSTGAPPGCNGTAYLHFSQFANGGLGGNPNPALLVVGTKVDCQWWLRDSGTPPDNVQLTNALEFTLGF